MKKLILMALSIMLYLSASSQETSVPKWKFGVSGGFSFLTASSKSSERELIDMGVPSDIAKDYYSDLKKGQMATANVVYLFKPKMGVGLKYNFFTSNAEKNGLIVDYNYDGNLERVNMKEQLYYNFVGPSFYMQNYITNNKKFQLTGQVAVGYLHYRNQVKSDMNLLLTGSTLGFNGELGIEYFLTKNWAIGVSGEVLSGVVGKVTVDDSYSSENIKLYDESRINMTHLGVLFAIRFYK
ncbi:outer membrane beta-barrel protein [Dysgonomonas sp. ZJ279]|uniref:outer membrane beta-barrel protein n=1 Tax=Dysgonomonas sp. ZJ279 TaxID=2709796 RepID=UPI0013EC5198|nr:outer membrane beta-barrel protein [Dysgonomonas sp. ZJ279]